MQRSSPGLIVSPLRCELFAEPLPLADVQHQGSLHLPKQIARDTCRPGFAQTFGFEPSNNFTLTADMRLCFGDVPLSEREVLPDQGVVHAATGRTSG